MKKLLCLFLALSLLTGVLCGCAPSAAEPEASQEVTQPTQPETKDPPRTAEDFLTQLHDALKAQNIPVEFVFDCDNIDAATNEISASWYLATLTSMKDPTASGNFQLCIVPEAQAGSLLIQFYISKWASEQEQQLYQQISTVAATLCDPNMTEEMVAALFAAEPSVTPYVVYTDNIGSFTNSNITSADDRVYTAVFCQPYDLAHYVFKRPEEETEYYQIAFNEAGEIPFVDKHVFAPTVTELEARINAHFAENNIPVECAFQLDYCHSFYNDWNAYFRFTDLSDPNYTYPVPEIEDRESQTQEYYECYTNMILNELSVSASTTGITPDAPIFEVSVSANSWSSNPYAETLLPGLMDAVAAVWDEGTGDTSLTALLQEEGLHARNDKALNRMPKTEQPYPLAPELLEFKYTCSEPMVQDGLFNLNQHTTDIFHIDPNSVSLQQISVLSLIDDYLTSIGASISAVYNTDSMSSDKFSYRLHTAEQYDYESNTGDFIYFAPKDFSIFEVNIDGYYSDGMDGAEIFGVFYGENANNQALTAYAKYAAIGLGQLLDEGMTAQEALELHTVDPAFTAVWENWEGLAYCPREVMHIICKDAATGQTVYFTLPKALFETEFTDLETFMAHEATVPLFQEALDTGWLEY